MCTLGILTEGGSSSVQKEIVLASGALICSGNFTSVSKDIMRTGGSAEMR